MAAGKWPSVQTLAYFDGGHDDDRNDHEVAIAYGRDAKG